MASRGVDSTGSGFTDPVAVVKALARKRGEPHLSSTTSLTSAAIVVLTGVSDYISDGNVVVKASNGHELVSCSLSMTSACPHEPHLESAL